MYGIRNDFAMQSYAPMREVSFHSLDGGAVAGLNAGVDVAVEKSS